MVLDVQHLIVLGILCSSVHWIVARSKIMQWLWSRARGAVASWLACAGCFGMWVGAALGAAGLRPLSVFYADELTFWHTMIEVLLTGLLGVFLTPVFEGVLLWGLETSAIGEMDHSDHPGLFKDVDE